jgi:hypothetical protein
MFDKSQTKRRPHYFLELFFGTTPTLGVTTCQRQKGEHTSIILVVVLEKSHGQNVMFSFHQRGKNRQSRRKSLQAFSGPNTGMGENKSGHRQVFRLLDKRANSSHR